jgi:hypothetical protein
MRPKRSNISKNMWKIQKTKCLVQNPRSWVFADKTLIFCESKPRNVEETAMHGGAKLHVWLWFCKQTASTYGPWLFSDFFKSWNGRRGGQHAHNCLLVLPLDIEHSCMPTNLMLDFRNLKLVSKLFMNSWLNL